MKMQMKVLAGLMLVATSSLSMAQLVGVSWSNFQEERWSTDEKAIKDQLAKMGGTYVSADAAASPEKQLADIDGLINKGAKVLMVLAMDKDAIAPALAKAKARGIPVIAYDRLIESPEVFYISFDNKEVGRMQARAIYAVKPKGNYAMIKGASTDPNADLLRAGQQEILGAAIKKGDIKIVGEEYTDGWKPEVAQKNMEQILTRSGSKVDAVVCSNDGMAGGVIAALSSKGIKGVPVSGQDGDHAALNRVALGQQTVSVWKDSRELGKEGAIVAIALAKGQKVPNATTFNGGERKVSMSAILIKPIPVTADKLDQVIAGGWVTKDEVCKGVDKATGPAACK